MRIDAMDGILAFAALCFLLGACGGRADVSDEDTQPDPTATQDGGSETDAPDAPAPEDVCLGRVWAKAADPIDFTTSPGFERQMFMHLQLEADDCADVSVDELIMLIRSTSGGAVCVGGCYWPEEWNFRNAKIAYAAGDLVGASGLYKADEGAGRIVFKYPNFSPAGKTIDLHVMFDVAADEVMGGTLYGQKFQVVLESVGASQAKHPDTVELALPAQSGIISVTEPLAAYCEPWSDNDPQLEYGYRGCCGQFQTAFGGPMAGSLFKGTAPPVYYLGSDSRRYVFTSSIVLDSWYAALDQYGVPATNPHICTGVKQYPDEILAAIPIGGNVTFRPGTYVTGIAPDPNRWVVSRGQTLRMLADLSLGEQIFPGTFESRTRRSLDQFFVDYTMGEPLTEPAQYDPAEERHTELEQDLGIKP